jgi:hypothetical protein
MASNSAAATALGFPGSASSLYSGASIADQLSQEDEETRRKRLLAMQQGLGRPGGLGSGYSGAISPAGSALGLS